MADETCSTCRWFWQAGSVCRRFPPQMVLMPNDNQHPVIYWPQQFFPFVAPSDWCGEWKAQPQPKREGDIPPPPPNTDHHRGSGAPAPVWHSLPHPILHFPEPTLMERFIGWLLGAGAEDIEKGDWDARRPEGGYQPRGGGDRPSPPSGGSGGKR